MENLFAGLAIRPGCQANVGISEREAPVMDDYDVFFPMTCARVAMVALEAVQVEYKAAIVNFFKGAQHEPR